MGRKRKTDLSFLIDLKWNASCHEWLSRARKVAKAVKKYHKRKSQGEVAKLLGMSQPCLIQMLVELRKVAEAGQDLDEYAFNGRKLASHNKIIAGGKNAHQTIPSHNASRNKNLGAKGRNGHRL